MKMWKQMKEFVYENIFVCTHNFANNMKVSMDCSKAFW